MTSGPRASSCPLASLATERDARGRAPLARGPGPLPGARSAPSRAIDLGRVGLGEAAVGAHDVRHGHVRDGRPVGQTPALEVGDAAPGEAVPELEEEPRLPDPGLADDPDGLAPAFLDGGEEIQQRLELPVAADEVTQPVGTQALERRAARPHTEESNHDDRLAPALDLNGPHALAADVALDEPPRRLAREDRARLGQLLEASRQVGGVADRRVVHAQVVADRAHDHEAGVQAHPDRQGDLGPGGDDDGAVAERAGDAEGGERRAARVILVGEGGAEERHEAVAEELVDRALVAVHLGEGGLEEGVHEDVHPLRPEPLGERRGADQVAEEHGDGLALAFQRAPGGEDPLGEVPRRVGGRRRLGRGGPSRSRGGDGAAALRAELRGLGELRPARDAGGGEPLPALETELRPRGILVPAPRTEHRGVPGRSRSGAVATRS